MKFNDTVRRRRSIRRFNPDRIPRQVVEDILQLAGMPASKPLSERYRVLVVSDKETIKSMRGACIDTIEQRAANWTDSDQASWAQLGIPFPKHDQIGTTQREHYRYFSLRFDTFFVEAPIVLVFATQPILWRAAPHVWPTLQLVGAAMQTVQLAATEKGIGACCMTGPLHSREAHQQILHLEPPWEIVALMPLGIPAYEPAPRPRKPVDDVFTWLGSQAPSRESAANVESEGIIPETNVELSEAIRRRRNVYSFDSHPVPGAEVREIVRTATMAPNSLNQQKWRFVAITARDKIQAISDTVAQTATAIAQDSSEAALSTLDEIAWLDAPDVGSRRAWLNDPHAWAEFMSRRAACIAQAPLMIAVLNESLPLGLSSAGWSDIESIGCAVETLMLAAAARGYGSCWMTSPLVAWQSVDQIVGACDPWRTVTLVPLGLPKADSPS